MHYGLVAVPATVERFISEFAAAWPGQETAQRATLPSLDAWLAWKREHERFVSARDWTPRNPGVAVVGFLQDGDWAVLLDTSHMLTTDAEALARLSTTFSRCLCFDIETAAGCASFAAYREGQLLRSIASKDGRVGVQGEPLPEEAGLDLGGYYMDETGVLQQRFGLRFLHGAPPAEIVAIATLDRTDYREQMPRIAPVPGKKPWWKLW